MKKKISIVLAFLLLLTPVYGSSITNKKNQLNDKKQNIESSKQDLAANNEKIEAMQAAIKKVDLQMVDIQDKIYELNNQISTKKKAIETKQVELDDMNAKKDAQYEDTKERMVQMYKNKRSGYIQVIFSSNNFWDAINKIEYIKRISDKDNQTLDDYKATIADIESAKQIIETEKADLEDIKNTQVAKKTELEKARNKKHDSLANLKKEQSKIKSKIEQMQEESDALQAEINRLVAESERVNSSSNSGSGNYSSAHKYSGGTFAWPVPGYYNISSEYNPRTSPISGKNEFHTGIDIPAGYGENVVAAADGVVIVAGWVNGYGNTVMINHGGGLVTLYGHNSSLTVSTGQTVTKGQTVAKIGSTGYSTGNHCHFEVRVNGSHTSPWEYLSK
ncbi:murein hydrolase activator EnvC family protein [Cellulosilyticum ruminicola]|uniref:murein hydrolase activator EnvC family protein n=1 Tax=Cellulosilyticum ruminicola TaxID=425254 RepID=UPI0006D0CB8F|nr:peptidoglycan DD-metalloendopeptidase family protein [Cellulosilyticum ruminicola]